MDSTTASIKVNPVEVDPCTLKLEIEVPAERADSIYRRIEKEIATRASLPGFRQGKVPRSMLLKHFGPRIEAETVDRMVNEAYREAIKDYVKDMIGDPKLDEGSKNLVYRAGQPFQYTLVIERKAAYELPNYKGLKLTRLPIKVTDQDVEDEMARLLESASTFEKSEGPTAAKNILTADYEATLPEGLEIPDTDKYLVSAKGTWLALREPEMLPGISTALLGLKPGESRDTELTFPADFRSAALAGKTLMYHFTIQEIRAEKAAVLDEAFAKRMGMDSVEALRGALRKRLEMTEEFKQRNDLERQINAALFDSLDFPVPNSLVEANMQNGIRNVLNAERQKGASVEDCKNRMEEIKAEARQKIQAALRALFAQNRIAEEEKMSLAQGDLRDFYDRVAAQAGDRPVKNVLKEKQDSGELDNYIQNRLSTRVYD
ncbi:MAG: trigger factor, partial [Victivallales bacterium]|nr:trigger factor [Victivallales bacterium]